MWSSLSNAIPSFGRKKTFVESNTACSELSDDETSSNARTEEGLECQICWESFNIVENVPYVLWCGHTLCKHCVLRLNCASLSLSYQQIQIPFFISCPWCNLLTLRLLYEGNLRFPRKNFFLLWMVESLNGDRMKSPLSISGNHQLMCSSRTPSVLGIQASNNLRRASYSLHLGQSGFNNDSGSRTSNGLNWGRPQISLHKSLDFFIRLTTKFPLVFILLVIVICVLPASAVILVLYLLITVLFAVPSFLVLYFAYPGLSWLVREIAS